MIGRARKRFAQHFLEGPWVTKLVDQRLADRDDDLVFVIVAIVFDRILKQRDAVGQLIAVPPAALIERRSLVQAQQGFALVDVHFVEQVIRRLVLDNDREIAHLPRELERDGVDGFFEQLAEIFLGHGRLAFVAALAAETLFAATGFRVAATTAFAADLILTGFVPKPNR